MLLWLKVKVYLTTPTLSRSIVFFRKHTAHTLYICIYIYMICGNRIQHSSYWMNCLVWWALKQWRKITWFRWCMFGQTITFWKEYEHASNRTFENASNLLFLLVLEDFDRECHHISGGLSSSVDHGWLLSCRHISKSSFPINFVASIVIESESQDYSSWFFLLAIFLWCLRQGCLKSSHL